MECNDVRIILFCVTCWIYLWCTLLAPSLSREIMERFSKSLRNKQNISAIVSNGSPRVLYLFSGIFEIFYFLASFFRDEPVNLSGLHIVWGSIALTLLILNHYIYRVPVIDFIRKTKFSFRTIQQICFKINFPWCIELLHY